MDTQTCKLLFLYINNQAFHFRKLCYVRSTSLRLKYQTFRPSSFKEIGNFKMEFLAKTQSIYIYVNLLKKLKLT